MAVDQGCTRVSTPSPFALERVCKEDSRSGGMHRVDTLPLQTALPSVTTLCAVAPGPPSAACLLLSLARSSLTCSSAISFSSWISFRSSISRRSCTAADSRSKARCCAEVSGVRAGDGAAEDEDEFLLTKWEAVSMSSWSRWTRR